MSSREQFYSDFAKHYGIRFKITKILQRASYIEGCPTCGGDMEFTVDVYGIDSKGKSAHQEISGNISDFINNLD